MVRGSRGGERKKGGPWKINLIIDIQNSSCDMCWYRVSETGREGLGHWLDHRLSGGLRRRLLDPGDENPAPRTCFEPSASYPMERRTHQDYSIGIASAPGLLHFVGKIL